MGELIVRRDGAIAQLRVSNPARRNAMTLEMMRALPDVLATLADDDTVRVVIVRGDSDAAFVAGGDISEFETARATREAEAAYMAVVDRAFDAPARCPKPVIAAIRGPCMGGGLQLAIGCDIRIAAEDASFRMPAARLGVAYPFAGLQRFVQVLGPAVTTELFFAARTFGAEEALRIGLLHQVLPVAGFDDAVQRYGEGIARNAPLTLAAAKEGIAQALLAPADRDLSDLRRRAEACWASRDFREGRDAFLQKRPPRFEGR